MRLLQHCRRRASTGNVIFQLLFQSALIVVWKLYGIHDGHDGSLYSCPLFAVIIYMRISIWLIDLQEFLIKRCFALQWRCQLTRWLYQPCPQRTCVGKHINNHVGRRRDEAGPSERVHVQQFPIPNNPPQCPPPLIIFNFLSHSPCPSFSHLPPHSLSLWFLWIPASL